MTMINLARIVNNPRMQQTFTVNRFTLVSAMGRTTLQKNGTLQMTGVIVQMSPKQINQIPEGDEISAGIEIYTTCPLYVTSLVNARGCDEVVWHGESYKVINAGDYSDYGFYKAMAVRKKGA